ncbi:hypothetical protein F2Q69_00019873 [Brassica cretica]|uniref:Conserved oligomeric Golgi complex subunit 7 n=1 Tax=Brassica cretica TaxID=69181 RepID=A0A8S9PYT8_BRACR|nr:hypothetical protein F2Q69_00019873 [Brassica cretica]
MMLDLGPFSEEKFDAKRWVNSSCQARHPQDSLERQLVDLEMKLQIASEEIGASLEEQSGGALLRVPRATRDVLRLRDDAVSLRSSVAGILQKLKKAEGSSADCIATLARVDCVKQRMEAAFKTLQDASGLTQLSSTVEDVFASGDLPRAAETLASMRNCLSAVGEVAEFANVRKQLEVLEDRLEAMVQPRLTDALTYHKVDVAQDLRGILIRIGRFKSLELQYSKVRLKPIKQLWDDFDTKQRANKLAKGSSADCIATLARVDCVKQRMEAAFKTLQDAAGLTQLSSTVEDVFASGDLPRAAETLASMRNCLSAVGEVAEFANVRKQLELLEDRLEAMVQPRLTDALTYHKVDVAQDLRGILIRIGRFKSLELQYSKVRLKPIKQLWDDFDTKQRANKLASERSETQRLSSGDEFQLTSTQTSFASWLPSFYDELLLYLEQEWKW